VVEYFNANAARFRSWHHEPLNATLHGRWRPCAFTWNAQEAFFMGRSAAEMGIAEDELRHVATNPRIVHFTGTRKPWSYYHVHPFRQEYFKYLALTPWKGFKPFDRPAAHVRARLLASHLTPGFIKQGFRRLARPTQGIGGLGT
jgi:lipopolysaccharide biosynthesis glycosyltransferase